MTDITVIGGGRPPGSVSAFNPAIGGAADFPVGTPVAASLAVSGAIVRARANDIDTGAALGLAIVAAVQTSRSLVQFAGPLRLTTAQWDFLTGDVGGLTRGIPYYLSVSQAGHLTDAAPVSSGDLVVPVGVALSATDLMVQVGSPVEVP